MDKINHAIIDVRLTWYVTYKYILKTNYAYLALFFFVLILFTLQWLFNLPQLQVIFTTEGLSFAGKLDILKDAFFNLFRFAADFTPISLILISLFQALAIAHIIRIKEKTNIKRSLAGLVTGLIGAGCVACGGSLLTPVLGVVASSVSVALAELISDILLAVAVILSYWGLSKAALVAASRDQ